MNKSIVIMVIAICAVIATTAWAVHWIYSPKSYEDCILRGIRSGQSSYAARLIDMACGNQFPKQPEPQPITPQPPKAHVWKEGIGWDPPLSTPSSAPTPNPFDRFDKPTKAHLSAESIAEIIVFHLGRALLSTAIWFTVAYQAFKGTIKRSLPDKLIGAGATASVISITVASIFIPTNTEHIEYLAYDTIVIPLFICICVCGISFWLDSRYRT